MRQPKADPPTKGKMSKQIQVKIKGLSALLMHAYPLTPIEALEKLPKEEQAEHAAYRDEMKQLFIPAVNMQRSLVSAATFSKGKGRASLAKICAASILVSPVRISLNTDTYQVDSRPVVIPATKGRIIRHRPMLENWQCEFLIDYEEKLMTGAQIRKIVDDAGSRVGVLDFRPECKGPFGRFMVTEWC